MTNKGKIIKGVGGRYTVISGDKTYTCYALKKVKYFYDDIAVGDDVEFSQQNFSYFINKILPRKNQLLRPAVSNIDGVYVIIAIVPQPDLLLVDKLIANCNKQNIPVSLVVNKLDITDDVFFNTLKTEYSLDVQDIFGVSSLTHDGTQALLDSIANKTICLAGQSAVGKTSLLNTFIPNLNKEVGDLSQKTERGKHTTRHNQIYALSNGGFVVDTAGFSLFDLTDIKPQDLSLYFNSFFSLSKHCRFNMCTHTAEPDCAVKQAVKDGILSQQKYQRYVELYEQLTKAQNDKYN